MRLMAKQIQKTYQGRFAVVKLLLVEVIVLMDKDKLLIYIKHKIKNNKVLARPTNLYSYGWYQGESKGRASAFEEIIEDIKAGKFD